MKFLNEMHEPIADIKGSASKLFWVYEPEEGRRDFFLKRYHTWYCLKGETYLVEIDKHVVPVPANFFMVIGDYDGGFDVVTPSEIVGREFEVLTFHPSLEEDSWGLRPVRIVGYEEEHETLIPFTKKPLPVSVSQDLAIMVSQTDIYYKIKNLDFGDIV